MSFTITICPRCNKDFMYHCREYNLEKVVAWDADSKEPCSWEVICQECYEKDQQKSKRKEKLKRILNENI